MVRIPYPNEEAPNEPSATGRELNIARMTRHFPPAMLAGFQAFGKGILSNDVLDDTLRELAILRVAHVSGSKYERYQHEHYARKRGVDEAKIAASGGDTHDAAFTPRESALLTFVDEIVCNVRASDESLEALQRHLSSAQIVTVMGTVGQYMMLARIIETSDIEIEEPPVML
jgi:alkylhydroperoxidase family enzyme